MLMTQNCLTVNHLVISFLLSLLFKPAYVLVFVTVPSQGRDNEDLAAGTHTYPFSFQLPVGVPASFEHPVGRVRYRVQGIVDVLWQFDIKTKTPITVTKALDLNLWPDMMVGCGFVC